MNYAMKFPQLIKTIHNATVKHANNMLKQENVTMSQLRFLIYLHEHPDEKVTSKTFETLFSLSQPTVVGTLSRLQAKDYVELRKDERDKRVKNIYLTKAGSDCCERANISRLEMQAQTMSSLSFEETKALYELLSKLSKSLEDYVG